MGLSQPEALFWGISEKSVVPSEISFFTLLLILQKVYSSHQCCHARQFSKCFLGIALVVFEPRNAFR